MDAERLLTLDGRSIDDGTPTEDAGTLDTEDYAVLFELDRLRAERAGERPAPPHQYDCLVLDEAQEFAPLELALLGRALAPGGSLIVAGDAAQQVDPAACFSGWAGSMAELGCAAYETAVLEISYRCPPDVTELARRVLDGGNLPWPPVPSTVCLEFGNECRRAELADARVGAPADRRSAWSAALICRTPEAARRLTQHLRRGLGLRLALDGDYQFVGGINVTCVQQAKGLEFDYVIVPDASAAVYPTTPAGRRALYVAVTRASHQLVLSTVGRGRRFCAGRSRLVIRSRTGAIYLLRYPAPMDEQLNRLQAEVAARRTFAIISHPDAGKTTLTEKLLLYGGAIARGRRGAQPGRGRANHQ